MPSMLLLLVLLSFSAPALAVYKCESGGKVVYSDTPCHDGGAPGSMKEIAITAPSPDTGTAQQKLAHDKEKLRDLEARRQKQEAIEEKERQKIFKANQAKKKKCADLALRSKWANEDAATARAKSAEKAKRAARRVAEKYELECGH